MLALLSLIPLFRDRLNLVRRGWHALIDSMFDPYRPELHYMRGPGPKWHAKRQGRNS
jgi:hypothetical protein